MRTIFLSAGHSDTVNRDQGAQSCEHDGKVYSEGKLTTGFRKLLATALRDQEVKVIVDNDNTVTKETVGTIDDLLRIGTLGEKDIAIDIHFNASAPNATGCEVLVPLKYSHTEMVIASHLVSAISEVLEIHNRGVKTEADSARGRLMFMTPVLNNILIEVCFISNESDLSKYLANQKELATVIAATLKALIPTLE